jgi:hypothetical protein
MQSRVKLSGYIIRVTHTSRAVDLSALTSRLHPYPPTFAPPVTPSLASTPAPLGISRPLLLLLTAYRNLNLRFFKSQHRPFHAAPPPPSSQNSSAAISLQGSPVPEQQEAALEWLAGGNPELPSEMTGISKNDEEQLTRTWSIDEDLRTDLMALVVLDDIPPEVCIQENRIRGAPQHNL